MRKPRPKLHSQAMTEPEFECKSYVSWFSQPPQSGYCRRPGNRAKNSRGCKTIYQGQHPRSTNWPNQSFPVIIYADEEEQVVHCLNINPAITGHQGRLMLGEQGKCLTTHWVYLTPPGGNHLTFQLGDYPPPVNMSFKHLIVTDTYSTGGRIWKLGFWQEGQGTGSWGSEAEK